MSQFMLLIRNEGVPMEGLSEEEIGKHMAEWGTWMQGLGDSLEGGLPFSTESAAIIGNNGVTSGYYKETNNISVGGYLLINAENLDAAVKLAQGCPSLHSPASTIEVRECMDMSVPAE